MSDVPQSNIYFHLRPHMVLQNEGIGRYGSKDLFSNGFWFSLERSNPPLVDQTRKIQRSTDRFNLLSGRNGLHKYTLSVYKHYQE